MSIRKSLLSIALVGAFAAPAFAADAATFASDRDEATYSGPSPGQAQQHSTLNRAKVQREVLSARQNGSLTYVGDYPNPATPYHPERAPSMARAATTEMGAARASDVNADGYRFVGGELGYVYVGPRMARAATTEMGSARVSDVNADGYRFVGGELGYVYLGPRMARATTTEMGAPRASDVNADGYRFVGGELGYVYVGPRDAH